MMLDTSKASSNREREGAVGASVTLALAPGASQGCPIASVRVTWATRPSLDDLPACTCVGKYGHHWNCPAKGAVETRRKTIETWDKCTKARERAARKLAKLSTPAGWKREWRAMQRDVAIVPLDPMDKAIQTPVSRYLLTMGERPCYIAVEAKGRRIGQGPVYEQHPQTATLGGPCACERCAAWIAYRLDPSGLDPSANSSASTGPWTCGCEIEGLGSIRVGVDQSVTVEYVNPCERHALALQGA